MTMFKDFMKETPPRILAVLIAAVILVSAVAACCGSFGEGQRQHEQRSKLSESITF